MDTTNDFELDFGNTIRTGKVNALLFFLVRQEFPISQTHSPNQLFHFRFILKSVHKLDTLDLVVFGWGLLIFWSLVAIFVVCELGERTTAGFDSFNETFYQCEWYLFPTEIERMLLIVILDAQKPGLVHNDVLLKNKK